MPAQHKNQAQGFTLLELMITVVVLAILLALTLPSYTAAVARAESNTLITALVGSVTAARGAAQNHETDAVLCPSRDGKSCSGRIEWQDGWIVGVDRNSDNNIAGGEMVIAHQAAFKEKVHMISTAGRTRLQFQPYGSNAGSNVTFTLCDRRGESGASAYVLNNSGHFREATVNPQNAAIACAGM